MNTPVKSRYFSIPGLLVDVSEIVAIRYGDDIKSGIVFRYGTQITASLADLKAIADYVEEYDAYLTGLESSYAQAQVKQATATVEAGWAERMAAAKKAEQTVPVDGLTLSEPEPVE